ncbi:MAG: cob(I)yrinic acid a,c-diamide adenosyltransferase [Bacteroidales bacterium]|nr:cob(I)yrinic acid a,c-diamide adenosyltransferase [Bacteroidales bacterium]
MSKEIKIYTKGGDKGETSLLGGTRVPKYHERIDAYGTVDELNSFVGLLRDLNSNDHYRMILLDIQKKLFIAESHLASDKAENVAKLPILSDEDISILENEIDKMNKELPELRSFILPGGHPVVSYCHIARTICRRAERLTIKIGEKYEIDELIVKYLNRLSDYFFVLARRLAKDFKVEDVIWKPFK